MAKNISLHKSQKAMAQRKKLIPVKDLIPKEVNVDSVSESKINEGRSSFNILLEAERCWSNMYKFRKERRRCLNYSYGNQWSDIVHVDGKDMTEEEYIKRQGSIPLKNNLIRKLINSVKGVYISQDKKPICIARDRDEQKLGETMTTVLEYNWDLNKLEEVYSDSFEEFLIGGLVAFRKWYGPRDNKLECWTDHIDPECFFIDTDMKDYRGWDCNIIGEIHDISVGDLFRIFAKKPSDVARLKDIYSRTSNIDYINNCSQQFGHKTITNTSFYLPDNSAKCRVIEVWNKETKSRIHCHDILNGEYYKIEVADYQKFVVDENNARIQQGLEQGMSEDDIPLIRAEWFIDNYWYYRFFSPTGEILDEGETPYEHGSHPYVFKMYPFVNAEIHSFVSDVLDQQRYVNRLITLYDFIMRASAKGVCMVPMQVLEDTGMTQKDFADEWARFNGVIFYTAKPGIPMPTQISSNSTNIGINELLRLQLGFFDEITGVNGSLQGKPGAAGTSGSYYAQQTQNATTSLLGILKSFSSFINDGAYKDVKNMQQFYEATRVVNISGKAGSAVVFDPEKVKNVEFDLSITEAQSTPVYRQMANDFLMEIWKTGQISLEMLLKNGDFTFSDNLLQDIKSQQEEMQKLQPGQQMPQALQQQAAQADPKAVNMLHNTLRGAA